MDLGFYVEVVLRFVQDVSSWTFPIHEQSFTFKSLLMVLSASSLQLLKSGQYCGICKKIWNDSDGGNWVRFLAFRFCYT